MLTDSATVRAIAYNRARAPLAFLDQTTWAPVAPGSVPGVLWVCRMQHAAELPVDGCLGPMTTRAVVSRYGPLDHLRHTRHPMPLLVQRWGYDHAHPADHDPASREWRQPSPSYEAYTADGSWRSGMLRLVAGWDPGKRLFSRCPESYISLDGGSWGLAHYWAHNAAPMLAETARRCPELAREAWGDGALVVADADRLAELMRHPAGKGPHRPELSWLLVGWRLAARRPEAIDVQARAWLSDKVDEGLRFARGQGWGAALSGANGGRILAACVRMCNSGAGNAARWVRAGRQLAGSDEPMAVLARAYRADKSAGGYGHPERWAKILRWAEFDGGAPSLGEVVTAPA